MGPCGLIIQSQNQSLTFLEVLRRVLKKYNPDNVFSVAFGNYNVSAEVPTLTKCKMGNVGSRICGALRALNNCVSRVKK